MIKANKLRIGNSISWETGHGQTVYGKVCGIEKDKIAISDIDPESAGQGFMLLQGVNPIPLTPKILEKCGFVWHKEQKDVQGKAVPGEWFHEAYAEYPGLFYLPQHGLKHLHQLQNLYFAITGEELEIKEL